MATPDHAGHPSLKDLTARFLAAKAAHATGDPEDGGEVTPHEVAGGFRTPTKLTWDEALAVFRLFGVEPEKLATPPEWAAFVNLEAATLGVPLAAGLYPQRFRQLPGQLADGARPHTLSAPETQPGFPALRGWIRKAMGSRSATTLLVASGVAAVLGDHQEADAVLSSAEAHCSGPWRAAWENQKAAVLWLTGRHDEAARAWASQSDRPAIEFNRGLAALFGSKPAAAPFQAAAAGLPESSGWSHLAKLYGAIAATVRP
jgi:hypothetical protein